MIPLKESREPEMMNKYGVQVDIEVLDLLDTFQYKSVLGWCKRETFRCCRRSCYGNQGSQHNSKDLTFVMTNAPYPVTNVKDNISTNSKLTFGSTNTCLFATMIHFCLLVTLFLLYVDTLYLEIGWLYIYHSDNILY